MVLRVCLSDVDFTRVRLIQRADPMWEVRRSLFDINRNLVPPQLSHLRANSQALRQYSDLLAAAPASGDGPHFFHPADGSVDIREGLASLIRTPRETLRNDLERFSRRQPLPPWAVQVADGDSAALRRLACMVHQYFAEIVAPHWRCIQHAILEDMDARLSLLTNGLESLLDAMGPLISWRRPYLIVKHVTTATLGLQGRGLTIQPSFFGQGAVSIVDRPGSPLVLTYPVYRPQRSARHVSSMDRPLGVLLGRTRAAALALLSIRNCTTTELATELGISLPSASQHAKVLRESGLVTTSPSGKAVVHQATSLGQRLAEGFVPTQRSYDKRVA